MTIRRTTLVATLATALIACTTTADALAADPLGARSLLKDVRHYVHLGPVAHLTGSEADAATQRWMRGRLSAAGLQTGLDHYTYLGFDVRQLGLTIAGKSIGHLAPYLYSGTTGATPRSAPLVYAGTGEGDVPASSLAGKIAVIDVEVAKTVEPTFASAFTKMAASGAIGLVVVTEGPGDFPVSSDVDSRPGGQKLPTLFVGKQTGQDVIAAAKAGQAAELLLDADVGARCTTNAWGILPGADPHRYIVIGTPTGAFTPSASERGPGVAALLGLARHYAALPVAQRPLTLVFAVLSGHEIGYLGLPTLMQIHPDWFSGADAYVHLGASLAAVEQDELPNGTVQRSSAGEASRALYVSENPLLEPLAHTAFAGAQPIASEPPGAIDPGEQGYAYHAGIPIVSSSGGSLYFHTAGDGIHGVSPTLLASMTDGFRGAIDSIASLPAGELGAANAFAAQLGAARSPNSTPGGQAGPVLFPPTPVPSC